MPFVLDDVRAFDAWADTRPADCVEPPRGVGMHATALRGARFERFTSPYTLYMVQRPLDAYAALAPAARARVDAALAGTGLETLLHFAPRHRVGKRDFKLVIES